MSPDPVPRLPERRGLRRRARDAATMGLIGLLAFVVGVEVFNGIIMPRLIHGSPEVPVPDLSNLSYEQAERLLLDRQLRLGRSGERYDPSVPRGFILAQDPLPDTPVRAQRRVLVMVSLGEEFIRVPALTGASPRGAALALEHAGLGFSGATHAPSDDVGEGMVVATDPAPETVVPHNWPVGVLISTGPGDETYVMPDLLGRDSRTAEGLLVGMGFRVEVRGARAGGPVIFQNPPPGTRIVAGGAIVLQAAAPRGRR